MNKIKYPCPCCGYKTLDEQASGSYNFCEVCYWEDDLIQLEDPDYCGGANRVSLREAQVNFKEIGASEQIFLNDVRAPKLNESRDDDWKWLD